MLLVSRLPATVRALSEGVISLPAARALAEETVGLDYLRPPIPIGEPVEATRG